ncbi:MAG: HIT family protein [bacterium]
MKECIFCNIVKGRIPGEIVYEDIDTIAILDIYPANKGHVLVIPRHHSATILDTSNESLAGMMSAAKLISRVLMDELEAEGINILQNNFKSAGQVIEHAHLHLIPRFQDDKVKFSLGPEKYEEGEIKQYAKDFRLALQQCLAGK